MDAETSKNKLVEEMHKEIGHFKWTLIFMKPSRGIFGTT
jgi:hypothetical protein